MAIEYFVDEPSIVRQIWGKSDTILFIFAGAAAEFALNKAVDWLYFTGRLPQDPLGRLFSTVGYARAIVFSEEKAALRAIASMTAIHTEVERKRGFHIPDWAYRDVLFMLIDYSIRSFELLDRKMTKKEKEEVFRVFNRVGILMGLKGLPGTFSEWQQMRSQHLQDHMEHSRLTEDLFLQYRKHLGPWRFNILKKVQARVVPPIVSQKLFFKKSMLIDPLLAMYKLFRWCRMEGLPKALLLPAKYKKQIKGLDR